MRLMPIVLLSLLFASTALAQSFNYTDFSTTTGLTLNGMATQAGTALSVAPAGLRNGGSAYFATPVAVDQGFDTTFTFQISNVSGVGGSGLAFVIHNDPRADMHLGDPAWAMGYAEFAGNPGAAVTESLVLELDMFQDGNKMDPSSSHLSLHTNGSLANNAEETYSLGFYNTPTDMSDGLVHSVRIVYIPGTLEIYYDNSASPVISVPYSFSTGGTWTNGTSVGGINLFAGQFAYVGFSASMPNTTAQLQDHNVLSWSFASSMAIPHNFPGNGADLAIDLSVNGTINQGQAGLHQIGATDTLAFTFSSPGGSLDGQPFGVAATVFNTGMPPVGIPGFNVYVDPANFVWLVDGFNPLNVLTPVLAPGGFSIGPYAVPASLTGGSQSLMIQLLTASPAIGLSDGMALSFQ